MMENVIVYFSITTEPKVMIIDVKSICIKFTDNGINLGPIQYTIIICDTVEYRY